MRSRQFINVMLTVIIGISMCVAAEPQSSIPTRGAVPSAPQVRSSGYPSLFFERNQGRTDCKVKFLSRGDGYSIFLTLSGTVLALKSSEVTTSAPSFTPPNICFEEVVRRAQALEGRARTEINRHRTQRCAYGRIDEPGSDWRAASRDQSQLFHRSQPGNVAHECSDIRQGPLSECVSRN
jgi:hypothetical protein